MIQSIIQSIPLSLFYRERAEEQQYIANISQKVLRATQTNRLWKNSAFTVLKNELSLIRPEQLKKVLETVSQEEQGLEAIDGLARILSPKRLEECLGTDGAFAAKSMLKEARDYLEKTKGRSSPSIAIQLSSFFDCIFSVLESFINAFGISEFFHPAESRADSKMKAQTLMMLLQFFMLLSTIALPLLGEGTAGIVIGSVLLSISLLSLVYPYIRRIPSTLPHAENWTRQYQLGILEAGEGRRETIQEIAQTLVAGNTIKNHPLLIGKSGVGKTEIAKAFVGAIETGKYPKLAGKKVFYINSADLINKEDGTRILHRLSEAMGRHRNDIILIFDEFHLVCQKRQGFALSDQLKMLLDTEKGFPYFIGITTEEEFYRDIYSNNPPLARRFKKIQIEDTNPSEMVQILKHALLKQSPKMLTEQGVFETLMRKTSAAFGKQAIEPFSSLKILSLCLKRSGEWQRSPLQKKIDQVLSQIEFQNAQGAPKKMAIAQLEKQLEELAIRLQQEKKEIEKLCRQRDLLADAKTSMYRSALKAANATDQTVAEAHQNKLLLIHRFLLPAKEENIRAEAERLGVKTILNSLLIDEAIQEEKDAIRKAEKMIARPLKKSRAEE